MRVTFGLLSCTTCGWEYVVRVCLYVCGFLGSYQDADLPYTCWSGTFNALFMMHHSFYLYLGHTIFN